MCSVTEQALSHSATTWSCHQVGIRLFCQAICDKMRRYGLRLHRGRFRLEVRKHFLMRKVIRHWKGLLREVMELPFLEIFKERLDMALSNKV